MINYALVKKTLVKTTAIGFILFILIIFLTNLWICFYSKKFIYHNEFHPKKVAIILGARVKGITLSPVLKNRMDKGIELYKSGKAQILLLSGDGNKEPFYNETSAMRIYAIEHGIPENDLVIDPYGYNTSLSMLRAKHIYDSNDCFIITQKFHLYRSLWLARKMNITAWGVPADDVPFSLFMSSRELFARTKDFFLVYLGDYHANS